MGCVQVPALGEERVGQGLGTSLMELPMAGWTGSPPAGGPRAAPLSTLGGAPPPPGAAIPNAGNTDSKGIWSRFAREET